MLHQICLIGGIPKSRELLSAIRRIDEEFRRLKTRPDETAVQIGALPSAVVEEIYDIIAVDSPRNPFRTERNRHRNFVLLILLLHLGLRRGEPILLSVDAIFREVDPRTGVDRYWMNVVQPPEEDWDPRKDPPSLKTAYSTRQIPIAREIAALVGGYVSNYRGNPPHSFLFTSQKTNPLASNSINEVFATVSRCLSDSATELLQKRLSVSSVTPHSCRHTAAVVRLMDMLEAGVSMEDALYRGGKCFLHFLCDQGLGSLTPNDTSFVRSFRGPPGNLYKSIETGEAFLSSWEQAAVVRYLDDMASAVSKAESVSADDLREAAVLICSKQHAMRPSQISKLLPSDVRIRTSENLDGGVSVHIRFQMAKQLAEQKQFPMLRKISSDWTPIFQEFQRRRHECDPSPIYRDNFLNRVTHDATLTPEFISSLYFRLTPSETSQCVKIISKKILGHARNCNNYRHTAAQRMVDSGATQEELAIFLGHSNKRTGNLYFRSSPDTVEHINKALGISTVFRNIENMYKGRTISQRDLETSPPEKQISGTVHGIPIPLIGKCDIGLRLCPKHPVVACYGCFKFAPVRRADRHEKVATVLRPVVREFFDKSAEGRGSSPYGQLRRTLETIDAIVDDLKGKK